MTKITETLVQDQRKSVNLGIEEFAKMRSADNKLKLFTAIANLEGMLGDMATQREASASKLSTAAKINGGVAGAATLLLVLSLVSRVSPIKMGQLGELPVMITSAALTGGTAIAAISTGAAGESQANKATQARREAKRLMTETKPRLERIKLEPPKKVGRVAAHREARRVDKHHKAMLTVPASATPPEVRSQIDSAVRTWMG